MSKLTTFKLTNGVEVINTTPHPITFLNPVTGVVTEVPTSGYILNASIESVEAEGPVPGIEYVKTQFVGNEEGYRFLNSIPEGIVVIGSLIAAQAYPGKVVAMVACDGFERVPPADKRMREDKFTIY